MQSIELLNMLEATRSRAAAQQNLLTKTREAHAFALQKHLVANEKKLRAQIKRQEMALALTNAEVIELEKACKEAGDLLTPPDKSGNKR